MTGAVSVKDARFAITFHAARLDPIRIIGGRLLIGRAPAEDAAEACDEQAESKMLLHLAQRFVRPTIARN